MITWIISYIVSVISSLSDAVTVFGFSKQSFGIAIRILKKNFTIDVVELVPVSSKLDHNDMWRWNQRVFRHRHPALYDTFDIVDMSLGEQWWAKYPWQDWRLVDTSGEQVGTYCLVPIRDKCFDAIIDGKMKETEITPEDIIEHTRIYAHQYWYLSNYMIARRTPGVPVEASKHAQCSIIEHVISRALESKDFSLKTGGEMHIVAFVEAPSIEKIAKDIGFQKTAPINLVHKTFIIRLTPEKAKSILKSVRLEKHKCRKKLSNFKNMRLFQQPPVYSKTR